MDFLKKVGQVVAPPPTSPYKEADVDPAVKAIQALQRPPRLHSEGFPEKRITDLHLDLPSPLPAGAYVPCVLAGDMLYVSGQLPVGPGGELHVGKVGATADEQMGVAAARACALTMLATVKGAISSLNRVVKLVKVTGFVNCAEGYESPQACIDGFSNVMIDVFGDSGKGARSAIGVASLPKGVMVEVEAIFQIKL